MKTLLSPNFSEQLKSSKFLEVCFNFGERNMPILIGQDVHHECIKFCQQKNPDQIFFIADDRVWELYGTVIESRYCSNFSVRKALVKPSEKLKTLDQVNRLLEEAIAAGVTRRSIVIALGGGLAGNIAGMVAGLLYRGISMVHMPTTFLAMSDSILSLKQAVNGQRGKNLFGMYYLPEASFVSVNFLKTLPEKELIAGINELIKNCLVFDAEQTEKLVSLIRQPANDSTWIQLVLLGIKAKQKLLLIDPYEKGIGISLEYGHTVGHALEVQHSELSHGIAVGLGMLVASAISLNREWLSEEEYWLHYRLLHGANPKIQFPQTLDFDKTLQLIRKDNKHGYLSSGLEQHPFVLLRSIGLVAMTHEKPLVCVNEAEILTAIERARRDIDVFSQTHSSVSTKAMQEA
ncbi:MAG: iron-containing alcohol dehydrogenase [Moorea sp. SIO1F2]|uniref:3-dehydroquinate synthase family protein n=1 Tax=unclassified Moorena TaxID=2683338 RepID=UPI0013BC94B7|nr:MULTISPECIES: iron-containing alcohol dehydrogenase [unclassified Moorena]NEN94793.1 iron-containing alcohol dehydrogenase [Moorena sp. SIO3I7]NEO44058.1 iron-containing alcohol dehydrogenase [Moorena sp. SIO4A3]NEO05754.1 iron-containing alcohol dehydrogenase [Moorena sp. SIO3I8]NEO22864.1 iron-containing alcohol dehydrogenase [Moorena sp. SIO4A5]NEP25075.1 iron-containing alcohol dehydrogenase [Moorena sp. SIO3I6]